MKNENMNRIQNVSGKFRILFTVLLALVPASTLLFWIFFNHLPEDLKTGLPVVANQALPLSTLALAFLTSLIPLSVVIYGLVTLKELFELYENEIIFSEKNVSCFRRLGFISIYWVIANMVFVTLISIVITFNNLPGEQVIIAQFGVSDIAMLIIGSIVVLISWVMNEASKLEDEQAHTV